MDLLFPTLRLSPWALLPLLAVALSVGTARHLRPQLGDPGAGSLLALSLAAGWWALLQLALLLVGDTETDLVLVRLEAAGAVAAPVAWFVFAMAYTGRAGLLRGPVGLVLLLPVATLLLAATNPSHGLLWAGVTEPGSGADWLRLEPGPWRPVHTATTAGLVAAATGVLIWHHAQSPRHRSRILVALAAPAALLLPGLLRLGPVAPGPWLDLAPTGFALAGALLAWGLLRQGRLVMAPVARTIVVEEIRDPILVLDRRGHIVDLNRAAREVLGLEPEGDVPVVLGTTWAVSRRRAKEGPLPSERVELETAGGETRSFELTLSALGARGGADRTVMVLRDVTERVRMQRKLVSTTEALREANQELERLAHTDALTGLANRRAFMAALEREVERSHRYGRPVSVVLLDLDHFKGVNDRFGHPAGDDVLRAAGAALREVSREIDVPARLGGEELGLLLPETDVDGARAAADRLRSGIAAAEHRGPEGEPFRVTASLGVACLVGEEGTGESLLQAADVALYEAKEGGRNQVVTAPLSAAAEPTP